MKKITVNFVSRTDPSVKYRAERHRDGKVTCFCPGFVYHGRCWHVERLKAYKLR